MLQKQKSSCFKELALGKEAEKYMDLTRAQTPSLQGFILIPLTKHLKPVVKLKLQQIPNTSQLETRLI